MHFRCTAELDNCQFVMKRSEAATSQYVLPGDPLVDTPCIMQMFPMQFRDTIMIMRLFPSL